MKNRLLSTILLSVIAASLPVMAALYPKPVDMKLLVLSADGNEPSFEATKSFLDYLGIPYNAVILKNTPLPALSDASKGFYQGIVLSTGNLSIQVGDGWGSALTPAQWTTLDSYMVSHGVRLASMYTFPEPRYGLTMTSAIATSSASPSQLTIPAAAASVFPYLNRANTIPVVNSYMYLATPTPATGETTTPILTVSGSTVGATHKKADGREYLSLMMDHNPYLTHSLALNYGVFNWLTKGVFLGERHIYMNPQIDDLFLDNYLYTTTPVACSPSGFLANPSAPVPADCPKYRMTGTDLNTLRAWQAKWQATTQFKSIKLTFAYNGFGITPDSEPPTPDSLSVQSASRRNDFFWINHTFDHENLDCFRPLPNSGFCPAASYSESYEEITASNSAVSKLNLPIDRLSMVTPGISGLSNPNFLKAAADLGIKYLVSDLSRPEWQPAMANTGVRSPYQSSILYIPRRATSIYYNTTTARTGISGSLTDEYNFFYGPNGLFKIGGTEPFFTVNQTYAQIIDRESDQLLQYMLRGEIYPTMYHQSNTVNYGSGKMLLTDVLDSTFAKFQKISNLPVQSQTQTNIGKKLEERMAYLAANVKATYKPGIGIAITSTGAVSAPLTGFCVGSCETYGGQKISKINVPSSGVLTIPGI